MYKSQNYKRDYRPISKFGYIWIKYSHIYKKKINAGYCLVQYVEILTWDKFDILHFIKGLPSCFCDDHFCTNVVEAFPKVSALQLHLDLLHRGWGWRVAGGRGQVRRGAERAGRPLRQTLAVRARTGLRIYSEQIKSL